MKRVIFAVMMVCLPLMSVQAARQNGFSGMVLVSSLEIGATQNPNRLFVADTGADKITELLVENRSTFAPWFSWSPDGQNFAYLAPARRGINYELWLADARISNPNPRTPLFDLGLTPVAAAWNPIFNIVAVGTASEDARDGLYLVNANFENVVFLEEDTLQRGMILDPANDPYLFAYSTADGDVRVFNSDSRTGFTLQAAVQPAPTMLNHQTSGWTPADQYYIFTDDIDSNLYGVFTADATPFVFDGMFAFDPFQVKRMPDTSLLLALYDRTIMVTDLDNGRLDAYDIDTAAQLDPDYAIANDGTLVLNGLLHSPKGDFSECMLLRPGATIPLMMRQILNNSRWTHTRCQLLDGGDTIALMTTDATESYDRLPEVWLYDLYIVPVSLDRSIFITHEYPGFADSNIGFSAKWNQVIFREGDSLVVYNLNGARLALAPISELGIRGQVVEFEFAWQP